MREAASRDDDADDDGDRVSRRLRHAGDLLPRLPPRHRKNAVTVPASGASGGGIAALDSRPLETVREMRDAVRIGVVAMSAMRIRAGGDRRRARLRAVARGVARELRV